MEDNKQLDKDKTIITTEELASPVCSIPNNAYDIKPHPDWIGFLVYKVDTEKSTHEL